MDKRVKAFSTLPAWRNMEMKGAKGAYLRMVCEGDSLFLTMGSKRSHHYFYYGPCEIDLFDVPHLEFASEHYAGLSHFLENHDWKVEVFKFDADSLSKQTFTKPLAYAPENHLVAIPDTGKLSQILIWNYQNQQTQAVAVDSCIYSGDPLPCIMEVTFKDDSLFVWRESKQGLAVDSLKVKVNI